MARASIETKLAKPASTKALNTKSILLTAFSHQGYGDLLFCLKLATQLKEKYMEQDQEPPQIYIISIVDSKKKILDLTQGNTEFDIIILSPDELKAAIENKTIDVNLVIEGPTFDSYFINQINEALTGLDHVVPLLMTPEYSFHTQVSMQAIERNKKFREKLSSIQYVGTIFSGFNKTYLEQGILISQKLVNPEPDGILFEKLDTNLQVAVLSNHPRSHSMIDDYKKHTAFSLQYSQDNVFYKEFLHDDHMTAAADFLKIHREFAIGSPLNQDVVMVGKDEIAKKTALKDITKILINDGFTQISFYNVNSKEEEIYYTKPPNYFFKSNSKKFRVLYMTGMSYQSMTACIALSGPLIGATGDQFFSESLSNHKIIVYECLSHKENLIKDYDSAIRRISHDDKEICEMLKLLRKKPNLEQKELTRLGELLRNPMIQKKIRAFNQVLLEESDLASHIYLTTKQYILDRKKDPQQDAPSEPSFKMKDGSIITARAILENQALATDHTILRATTGFYKLNESIGEGNFGSVYQAQYFSIEGQTIKISQPLAIKSTIKPASAKSDTELNAFKAAYPESHFERFQHGPMSYLAMPLISGVQLDKYLTTNQILSQKERIEMVIDLYAKLQTLHLQGFTHNDLKLQNLLYDPIEKKIHLIDFGCAEANRTLLKYDNIYNSIFAFEMPPEYLTGTKTEGPLDIFSATSLAAELLGLNKILLVTDRMEEALKFISRDPELQTNIRKAFVASGHLGDAFFHPLLTRQENNPNLKLFIEKYVSIPYDFSIYQEQLGEDTITLLNKMQAQEPKARPSAEECLKEWQRIAIMQQVNSIEQQKNQDERPAPF